MKFTTSNNMTKLKNFCAFCVLALTSLEFISALEFKYHDNNELKIWMDNFTSVTKNIFTELTTIGNSSNNVPLLVMELSAHKKKNLAPNIKFVANIHGNEAVGREILLHFMEYLRDNYDKDSQVKCLLDNTRIHFLPSMNPDGFAVANQGVCDGDVGRGNRGKDDKWDLNRSFPDFYQKNRKPLQPETEAIMKWMDKVPFILSAGLHGGAMVANYPFDTVKTKNSKPSLTPDDDVFKNLALVYSKNHPKMRTNPCGGRNFKDGITNGAEWYPVLGGMQDYNYFAKGCMELTLEISCCKYPRDTELPSLWQENKQSLLMYSLEALKGVKGQIVDSSNNKPIPNAHLQIEGRNMIFNTTEEGEFWRILLPGKYRIKVQAPGYYEKVQDFTVLDQKDQCPKPTKLKISLTDLSVPTKRTPVGSSINDFEETTESNHILYGGRSALKFSQVEKLLDSQTSQLTVDTCRIVLPARIPNGTSKIVPITSSSTNETGISVDEGLDVLRFIFNKKDLLVSELKEKEVKKLFSTEFQFSTEEMREIATKTLKGFDQKTDLAKYKVFVEIFDILSQTSIEKSTSKWLIENLKNDYEAKDLASHECLIRIYDKSGVFSKIKIILIFSELLAPKNGSSGSTSGAVMIMGSQSFLAYTLVLVVGFLCHQKKIYFY